MGRTSKAARSQARAVSRALVECLSGDPAVRSVPPAARQELVDAARFHRIAPLVGVAHRQEFAEVAQLFEADRFRAIATHMQSVAALRQWESVMGEIGWVTFKGAVFSEHAHPVPGLRCYNDIDVLVDPADLREACRRLGDAGWRVVDYRDMLRNEAVPGEMHWVSPGGVLFDVHWSMINMAARRALFHVPTRDLIERRIRVGLGEGQVWALDPTDALLHACLHAALSGAHKLVYLVDVDQLSRAISSWDEVSTRARQWGVGAQVAVVLGRARRELGTQVPADLEDRLGVPATVRALTATANRLAPVARNRSDSGVDRFVARAVRSTSSATLAAAAHNGLLWARGSRRAPAPDGEQRLGPDAESLDVYLAAVERASSRRGDAPAPASVDEA